MKISPHKSVIKNFITSCKSSRDVVAGKKTLIISGHGGFIGNGDL